MIKYNPSRHITARDLRKGGIPIPLQIPADAFILRNGWKASTERYDDDPPPQPNGKRLALRMTVEFKEPFRDESGNVYWVDPKGNIQIEQEDTRDHGRHSGEGSGASEAGRGADG